MNALKGKSASSSHAGQRDVLSKILANWDNSPDIIIPPLAEEPLPIHTHDTYMKTSSNIFYNIKCLCFMLPDLPLYLRCLSNHQDDLMIGFHSTNNGCMIGFGVTFFHHLSTKHVHFSAIRSHNRVIFYLLSESGSVYG